MGLVWCFLLATALLSHQLVQAVAGSTSVTAVQCLHGSSKKCTIPVVNITDASEELMLPNLNGKTTLQIKGGNLAAFGENLCLHLGTVRKLQLGPLGLKELWLTPYLREVSASSNQIEKVQFSNTTAQFKLEILDLSGNKLKTLDGFNVLVNLVEVRLENNALENFDWAVFHNMTKLEKLYLNANHLQTVDANEIINLPALDYLSLANNHLTYLDVTNWQFESLTEYDFSSNNLSQVNALIHHFPSSQAVLLANNHWFCGWLQDTLEHFNETFVTIKDRDEHCEGITSVNICCTPESDIISEDTDLQIKLGKLESAQKDMRSKLESQFSTWKSKKNNELTDLENKLMLLVPPSTATDTPGSGKNSQYVTYERQLQQVQSTAEQELKQVSLQRDESERAQRRLTYTILELKTSLDKGKKTTAGLQTQLDNLRANVIAKAKKT